MVFRNWMGALNRTISSFYSCYSLQKTSRMIFTKQNEIKSLLFKILKYCLCTWNNTLPWPTKLWIIWSLCTSLNCSHSGLLFCLEGHQTLATQPLNTIPCAWNALPWPLYITSCCFFSSKFQGCLLRPLTNIKSKYLFSQPLSFITLYSICKQRERGLLSTPADNKLPGNTDFVLCSAQYWGPSTMPGNEETFKSICWINRQQAMCNLQFASLYHYM